MILTSNVSPLETLKSLRGYLTVHSLCFCGTLKDGTPFQGEFDHFEYAPDGLHADGPQKMVLISDDEDVTVVVADIRELSHGQLFGEVPQKGFNPLHQTLPPSK